MALQMIVVGDATSHGGRVITGSETHSIDGKRLRVCTIWWTVLKNIRMDDHMELTR